MIGAAPVVTIWSDGSCDNRPREAAGRVGGYAALVDTGSSRFEIFGAETEPTTSNRMELMAAIAALEFLTAPSTVKLHSDSQYLVNNACGPLAKWQANGWKNSLGEDVKNADLWRRLVAAMSKHVVDFQWVKGHVGQPLNERADELAGAARARALNGEAVPLTITEIANVPGDTPADTTGTTSVSSLIDAPPTVAGVITNASVGEIPAGSVATDDAVGRANGATDLLDFLRGQPAAETGGEGATP